MLVVTGPFEIEGEFFHAIIFYVKDGDESFRVMFQSSKKTNVQTWRIQKPERQTDDIEELLKQAPTLGQEILESPQNPTERLALEIYQAWAKNNR